ncbi:hypothetical protein BJF92_13670 [Rhizobium rhizosphaerae]|uniref:Uncharacterized protein n=1 Tax=Xaviernesmea rhizosphaerae TaxID=1672749 RepID=A0A1Q9AHY7_9HYPH|nr:hypothetical protein [Xaviernesmea rhizosphaerae]OLP54853.1 hypothetical protein BJF92_13670 [Xaviernesmea rhizosphaerae]
MTTYTVSHIDAVSGGERPVFSSMPATVSLRDVVLNHLAWHLDDLDFTDGHLDEDTVLSVLSGDFVARDGDVVVEVVNAEQFRHTREIGDAEPGAFFIDGEGAACELNRLPCPPYFDPDGIPF